ncbi:hypothetical protein [Luteimonas sp. R10]|uniref:hypothetical protein n=1 Tax=Luteimonas sp. R10 TaxID=3108176 RepID=UPI00308D4F3D|nr:hypothetical protein U3649_14505 [Luteimonas sp. R10]
MNSRKLLLTLAILLMPCTALAEVCLNDDGIVIPCPPSGYDPVPSRFAEWPSQAGVRTLVVVTGGQAVHELNAFTFYANGQRLCSTDDLDVIQANLTITPVRYCWATIATPGVYTLTAIGVGSNSSLIRQLADPDPITITVQP